MSPAQRRRAAHQYRRSTSTFATIVMSAGLVLATTGAVGAWRGIVTQSWPTVEATLILSEIEAETEARAIPMTDRLRGGIKEAVETERLVLAYRYTVDGVPFEGAQAGAVGFWSAGTGKDEGGGRSGAGWDTSGVLRPTGSAAGLSDGGAEHDVFDATDGRRGADDSRVFHRTDAAPRLKSRGATNRRLIRPP